MSFPKKVRLHFAGGREHTESFATFCTANGGLTREQGKALLDRWLADGSLIRRTDGGFDVIKPQPRQRAVANG